jgi:hypothetical protein
MVQVLQVVQTLHWLQEEINGDIEFAEYSGVFSS